MLCTEGSELMMTKKATAQDCRDFFNRMEKIQEDLELAIKVGRKTYGKQINREMLMEELSSILDSAISSYGKEI
jgi:hypothetical protein